MRIGILVSMINNFGEKGFYNSQEVGMGKALASMGHDVTVYKLIKKDKKVPDSSQIGRLTIKYSNTYSVGINGIVNVKILDKELDGLVFFSDTQLAVPRVYKWCTKNGVIFIPYIGVIESHSKNITIKRLMDILFIRNIHVFRKSTCLVKNHDVLSKLPNMGINNSRFSPVGIDLDLVYKDFEKVPTNKLKEKYGFKEKDKIILFIGRLVEEKRPVDLIRYFDRIHQLDNDYRLLLLGTGHLRETVLREIENLELCDSIKYIEKFPNDKIWELYHMSECFINLNNQEIFGMVLLEAMFYKTKVVAWHAPGPDYIIENGVSGYLISNENELYRAIFNKDRKIGNNAQARVLEQLTWTNTANQIIRVVKGNQKQL